MAAVNVPLSVKEALYPGSTTAGISRTDEPLTIGVPLPDSAGISRAGVLGLQGATAAQFTVEGTWPSGNIKWVKVRAMVPSVAAGGSSNLTLTDAGTGNFGGADLATDNGQTITISTGSATFTVRKANFNVVDQVVVGGQTVVAGGSSQGLVVLGPDPTAAYPGNVTCLPTAGGTACNTVYASSNDPNSTAVIEENGPAATVIKATGSHLDGNAHAYMRCTARLYFYKNKNYVKITAIMRNADYGKSSTFTTAYKGHQGYELRIKPNISGPLSYTIGNHTSTPTAGTLNSGTDSVYLYQAESTLMKEANWCDGTGCVPYSSQTGYSIVKNGTALISGTAAQYPAGWADISDANGVGVEIGQYQLAAYGNKSLEFNSGGSDVRIGMWARQNNQPYYQPYPQWNINEGVYMNFHAASQTAATLSNELLKLQHYLLGRATPAYYDSTAVFPYPLLDPTEETNYYSAVSSSASPAVSPVPNADMGTTTTWPSQYFLNIWRFYAWEQGGGGNQMEFHLSRLLNFIRRGYTGGYLDSAHFYKMTAETAYPMSDGFNWRDKVGETDGFGNPAAVRDNRNLGIHAWMEYEHAHTYGMPDYYFLSGDETIKEAILEGAKDRYLNSQANNVVPQGTLWSARAVGGYLMWDARLYWFLGSIGDPDALQALTQGQTTYKTQVQPDLCVSGYPAGCVPDKTGGNAGPNQRGTSRVRGVHYSWADTSVGVSAACGSTLPTGVRSESTFMTSILLQGLWEFRKAMGPSWANYNEAFDLAYGISQWALGEMYVDNGQQSFSGNGFRYKQALDYPNACNTGEDFAVENEQTVWFPFFIKHQYEGSTNWKKKFDMLLQRDLSDTSTDEFYQYTIGALIYLQNHPNPATLSTVPITNFVNNGNGSYTITWNVPAGATSYRIKWGAKQLVDWIGFDAGSSTFIGNPATTMNWFAASDAPSIPTPAGSTQSLTINTGTNGLTAANFMVKAYTGGTGVPPPAPPPPAPPPPTTDTTPPTVSVISPAVGANISGIVTLSATATDNVGVTGIQFMLDGINLGGVVNGAGPSFALSWDSKTAGNGSHLLSATALDAAGNTGVSSAVSISVNNSAPPPPPPPSGGGSVALNSWTAIKAHGVPAQIYGYDKSVYVSSRKLHCIWGGYHQTQSSEPQNATVCYSYPENRWSVLQNNGMWHSSHIPGAGHTSGIWAYMPDRDTIVSMTDGSGSSAPEEGLGHWWWFDVAGLSGQNKEFSPRPWLGVTTTDASMVYDSLNSKLVLFPDVAGVVEVCDPATNSCAAPKTTGTAPPSLGNLSMAYNSNNHKVYLYGGGQADMYTFDVATGIWEKLAPTCSGANCVSGKPPARRAAGLAYSTKDNVFLMAGGVGGELGDGIAYTDTWIFDPVAVAWKQQTASAVYANENVNPTFERLTYDEDSNVFVLMSGNASDSYADGIFNSYSPQIWAYAYSAALNYQRISNTYTPPAGSLNRVSPTGSSQSWAFDPAIATAGNTVYAGWLETGTPFDTSNCGLHHPYIQSASAGSSWTQMPGGTQNAACLSIDPEPASSAGGTDGSKLMLAAVNGRIWEAHEKWNNSGLTSSAWAKSWDGSAWTGGRIGCFSAACSDSVLQTPQSLIANGATPTVAVIEENRAIYVTETYVYVAQWNGSAWSPLGGKLNVNGAGTRALFAALASDGTNPAACWAEEVNGSDRRTVLATPQIQCAQWNGSSWSRFGSTSLNQSSSSWAYDPTMTYVGGKFYVGWVERTTSGVNKLYVCRWDGSSCTLLGGGALNVSTTTGWAAHPSLTNDGTNVLVAWEEQSALGRPSLGFVKKWNGSSWSQLGGALNADSTKGSVEGISMTVVQGTPTAIWGELTFGNLRQTYVKQWNGTAWTGLNGTAAPPPPPPATMTCDLNGDGQVNVLDVQIAINQAMGTLPCTSADLQQIGQCTVIGVQRVVNASLGGTCRIGN
jgi:hypothetical protein